MRRLLFPSYPAHDWVQCFNCAAILDGERWVRGNSAPGNGEFYQRCNGCGFRTWYDLKKDTAHG